MVDSTPLMEAFFHFGSYGLRRVFREAAVSLLGVVVAESLSDHSAAWHPYLPDAGGSLGVRTDGLENLRPCRSLPELAALPEPVQKFPTNDECDGAGGLR